MPLFGPRSIGLALGSGAARGLAHIGVLRVLEAEGLAPDVVAGTSMGALIGAFYAAGIPVAEIEAIALEFDVNSVSGVSDIALGKGAVFSGDKVQSFLRRYLPATFEELRIPFGCVATDLTRNEPKRFTSGDLIGAVRASVSIPVAFLPVRMDDMLLVDGYICEPVPVRLARHLGGKVVVAVDVCGSGIVPLPTGDESTGVQRIREMHAAVRSGAPYHRTIAGPDIMGAVSEAFEKRVAAPALKTADIVLSPEVHEYGGFEFGQAPVLIEAGEQAAREAVEKIRRKARR